MTEQEGTWAAVRSALQFAAPFPRGDLRTEPANYVTTGVHTTFELMVRYFPRTREWEAAAAHYRTLFAAHDIRPRDILLRPPVRKFDIGPHVQEFPAGLHVEWEDRLTRWTLGVRHALEAGDALLPFPTAAADTLGGGPGAGRPTVDNGAERSRRHC